MCIAFVANVVVFVLRLIPPPWPYTLHLLATAWLIIAITLGAIVARAVFGQGRVTYHRIIGAVLLYLLIGVGFTALFALVGLTIPDAFKGISLEDNAALVSEFFYLSFATLTSTGYGDIVPVSSAGAKSLQYRSHSWPTLSGHAFGEASDPPIARQIASNLLGRDATRHACAVT